MVAALEQVSALQAKVSYFFRDIYVISRVDLNCKKCRLSYIENILKECGENNKVSGNLFGVIVIIYRQ